MSNLIRWDPMRGTISLREAMDRLFEDAFTHPFAPISGLQMPAIDLYQTDEEVVVRATLPGIKAEEVKISLTGDMLTIKGELKEKEELKEKAFHIHESRFGSFERTLSLPVTVIADKAKADFEDGILTITLPKAEEVKPKAITIKVK